MVLLTAVFAEKNYKVYVNSSYTIYAIIYQSPDT